MTLNMNKDDILSRKGFVTVWSKIGPVVREEMKMKNVYGQTKNDGHLRPTTGDQKSAILAQIS